MYRWSLKASAIECWTRKGRWILGCKDSCYIANLLDYNAQCHSNMALIMIKVD